jgi:hypothetical protein
MLQVVNAYGNLNGTHPDPLDEDLHALVTADSMVSADQTMAPLLVYWEAVRLVVLWHSRPLVPAL